MVGGSILFSRSESGGHWSAAGRGPHLESSGSCPAGHDETAEIDADHGEITHALRARCEVLVVPGRAVEFRSGERIDTTSDPHPLRPVRRGAGVAAEKGT